MFAAWRCWEPRPHRSAADYRTRSRAAPRKLEALSPFVSGSNGGAAGDTREVLSLTYQYGLTDFWLFKAGVLSERPVHGDHQGTAIVFENVFEIQHAKKAGGLSYGVTALSVGVNEDVTTP